MTITVVLQNDHFSSLVLE